MGMGWEVGRKRGTLGPSLRLRGSRVGTLVTARLGQQLWGPGSVPGHAPTLSHPSQYTANLEQELQNLTVDMKSLDLLSPAGHRDLRALQSSGLGNIHYPGFLIQVRVGPSGQSAIECRGPQRIWGVCLTLPQPSISPQLPISLGGTPDQVLRPVQVSLGRSERASNTRLCPWS